MCVWCVVNDMKDIRIKQIDVQLLVGCCGAKIKISRVFGSGGMSR